MSIPGTDSGIVREDETRTARHYSPVRDVVFTFNYVTWDDAVRRGMAFAQDRLAAALLAHPGVGGLVIADPFRSLPGRLRRRAARAAAPQPARAPATSERTLRRHRPLRLRSQDPEGIGAIERCYRAYDRRVRGAAGRAGLERPVVITSHPLVAGFAPLEWAERVVFYATDDWTAYPARRRWWPAYEEGYERIRQAKRSVCAVSEPIIERLRPTGPCAVIPNGVEPSEWMGGRAPEWLEALPHPRLLYVGSLDSRLDVTAIESVARAHRSGSVLLVGPPLDEPHIAPLRSLPNVHIRRTVDRATLPALVMGCDVAMVPHVRSRLTTAMSPLKVYEYLAGGRPVASIDLPPLRDIDSRVVLAPDSSGFAGAVKAALALGTAPEEERRAFLDANSWERRHAALLDLALGAQEDQLPGAR
jgi:glycosyltransferase involved in cell wall biosynthesis